MQHIKFILATILALVAVCTTATAGAKFDYLMIDEKVLVTETEATAAVASFKVFVINEIDGENAIPAVLQSALATKVAHYVTTSAMNQEFAAVMTSCKEGFMSAFLKTKSITINQNAVANSQFSLNITGKIGGTQVLLLDENGKVVFKSKQTLQAGMQVGLGFDLSKYQSNTYYLKVTNGNEQVLRKIMVA